MSKSDFENLLLNHKFTWSCPKCNFNIFPFNNFPDDNDFAVFYVTLIMMLDIDISFLKEKLFIPFDLNDANRLPPTYDAVPDLLYL